MVGGLCVSMICAQPADLSVSLSFSLSLSMFQESTVTDLDPPPRGIIYYGIFLATIYLNSHSSVQKTKTQEGISHLLSK